MKALRDRYGFLFWLRWILTFAGSFIASALCWNWLFRRAFGPIQGPELTISWVVAVFGSWFLLVIPFMRKKEQIWKRMNSDQEKAVDAWLLGMAAFIGLLIASSFFWSVWFRQAVDSPGLDGTWAKAVFGSWLILLLPFLVLLYRKADTLFKNAVQNQMREARYRSIFLEPSRRVLPEILAGKVKSFKPILPNGHVVTVLMGDGRRIPHVFIGNSREVLGIYDFSEPEEFDARQIVDIELIPLEHLPAYEEKKWTRLDIHSRVRPL